MWLKLSKNNLCLVYNYKESVINFPCNMIKTSNDVVEVYMDHFCHLVVVFIVVNVYANHKILKTAWQYSIKFSNIPLDLDRKVCILSVLRRVSLTILITFSITFLMMLFESGTLLLGKLFFPSVCMFGTRTN